MILYIGNNLSSSKSNVTTMQLLSVLLKQEGFDVECCSSKANQVLRLVDMLYSIVKYRKRVKYILIDTYSTKNFYYAFLTSQLARLLNLKYIPILHGGNLPDRLVASTKMSEMIFKNSYRNIAPSNYLKSEFQKHGFTVDYMPNVLEVSSYTYKQRKVFQPKLLYVRALHRLYNPKMAIQVLAKVLEEYPNAELCMVGPDKDGSLEQCKYLSETLGIDDSVTFTGLLSKTEWHELSNNYDIFINTTTIDNTPISVMEAMALGLVVVSTNVGGMPYLIADNETGILVESNNIDDMVRAIEKITSNHLQGSKITSEARRTVEQFDWSVVKESWKAVLK
jgi:glycosyltransferase involved in cell wall biosynthesis